MQTSRNTAGRWRRAMLAGSLLLMLTSTTACSRKFVAVDKGEMVQVPKGDLERMHQDNELLLEALKKCKVGK